jgi:hypothetical protein
VVFVGVVVVFTEEALEVEVEGVELEVVVGVVFVVGDVEGATGACTVIVPDPLMQFRSPGQVPW